MNHIPAGIDRQSSRGKAYINNMIQMRFFEVCLFSGDPEVEELRTRLRKQRNKLVLWRRPVTTLHYFVRELMFEAHRLTVG